MALMASIAPSTLFNSLAAVSTDSLPKATMMAIVWPSSVEFAVQATYDITEPRELKLRNIRYEPGLGSHDG